MIVIDDCGAAVATAQVVATFSNGDAPMVLSLVDSANGVYSGTWIPRHSGQLVSITGKTSAPNFATVSTVISGQVTPGLAPALNEHSVLQIFNPVIGGALAPGNIVQMYGTGLAAQPAFPLGVPLPVSLAGTSVFIGGIAVPLFYAGPNQINAQVPYELAPGRQYQVIVSANGALTAPETIQVNTVAPGVLGYLSGALIAQHATDFSLVTEAAPAKPGEYVTFYLAGMGTPDVPVATGAAAPGLSAGDTLARPQVVPTLTVNGKPVSIYFAGLSPGYAGLYQVSFQIPADVTDGELSVVITQGSTLSNSLVLPISH